MGSRRKADGESNERQLELVWSHRVGQPERTPKNGDRGRCFGGVNGGVAWQRVRETRTGPPGVLSLDLTRQSVPAWWASSTFRLLPTHASPRDCLWRLLQPSLLGGKELPPGSLHCLPSFQRGPASSDMRSTLCKVVQPHKPVMSHLNPDFLHEPPNKRQSILRHPKVIGGKPPMRMVTEFTFRPIPPPPEDITVAVSGRPVSFEHLPRRGQGSPCPSRHIQTQRVHLAQARQGLSHR